LGQNGVWQGRLGSFIEGTNGRHVPSRTGLPTLNGAVAHRLWRRQISSMLCQLIVRIRSSDRRPGERSSVCFGRRFENEFTRSINPLRDTRMRPTPKLLPVGGIERGL
jgi:hypothetical protein